MSATDPIVTLAWFLKLEAPDGDVRLCEGGMLDYASERYEAEHPVFGVLHDGDELTAGFGDMAEAGTLVLAPSPAADEADWWRADLAGCRVRIWMGELDADGVTVSSAKQLADWLVDTIARERGPGGVELLRLGTIGRPEKLFLKNEGNVCSQRFHQSVWAGEKGFNNCTELQAFFAWGAEAPVGGAGGIVGGASGMPYAGGWAGDGRI